MSALHELPGLPSLPPLSLPTYHEPTLAPPLPSPGKTPSHLLQSPSLSIAESFSTAYTSTTPADDLLDTDRLGTSSLAPPPTLRKSLSVDSFAQYTRDDSRDQISESSELSRNHVYGMSIDDEREPAIPTWSARSRGHSLSSVQRDHESPPPLHDVDRCDITQLPVIERFRRQSLKSPDSPSTTGSPRGGYLPLPSRGSTSTNEALNELGELPSPSSTSSLQSSARRGSAFPLPPAGRLRSGSLGYNPPKRTTQHPHLFTPARHSASSQGKSDIVLLVIGSKGCGKSTVIKRGLSRYGIAVEGNNTNSSELSGATRTRYIKRTGNVVIDQPPESPGGTPHVLDVLEVEAQMTSAGLLKWPQGLPPIDGVILCYDVSDMNSYQPIEGLLKHYRSMIVPIMVLACKADLKVQVDPNEVVQMLQKYDTGLIEVSNADDAGKDRMRRTCNYLLLTILRQRGPNRIVDNRNPATPSILISGDPWTTMPNSFPLAPSINRNSSITNSVTESESSAATPTSESISSVSPTGPSAQADGVHDPAAMSQAMQADYVHDSDDAHHNDSADNSPSLPGQVERIPSDAKRVKKEPRPSQWADLNELLDKLLFLAISGDDPTFATHFLLTYRRFTTPRTVLLAMQKRMRELDQPSGDPMFACFAQMRICHLLETWIHHYAHDFAVKGTAGALNALIRSIISKTHLLHYGSEFLPFLEQLPSLVDEDTAWAMKADVSDADSDDYIPEDEEDELKEFRVEDNASSETPNTEEMNDPPQVPFPSRERKASLPLSKVRLSVSQSNGHHPTPSEQQPKQYIRELVKLAQDVLNTDSEEIAQEITRQGEELFLRIKPRDWLNYTFVSKKQPDEPITEFNTMSNRIADWVVTLILCHERPRHRARQIEKFIDIALKLRNMNNYSALRAFVAGINNASDDATMEVFKAKFPDHAKNLRSWDVLLQQVRAHRAYRLALRNSKGACIPALEVHISDLIRAHEGNGDTNSAFPSKIHWGKFNMMGRFITTTIQCQNQCRTSKDYQFMSRPLIDKLLRRCTLMTTEMQKSRLKSQDDYEDVQPIVPVSQPKDISGMRRIFFW